MNASERLTTYTSVPLVETVAQDDPILEEEAHFLAMKEYLLQHYLGQYVALYQGQVIDSDMEEVALVERVDEKMPDAPVLLCGNITLFQLEFLYRMEELKLRWLT